MLLQKFSCRDKKVTCAILITKHKHRRQRKKLRVEHNQSDNNRLQKNIIAKNAYILLNIKNSLHEKKYYSTQGYA
jgi:urease alpha subunit